MDSWTWFYAEVVDGLSYGELIIVVLFLVFVSWMLSNGTASPEYNEDPEQEME